MDKKVSLGLDQATTLMFENLQPLSSETVEIVDASERVLASDVSALVDSPSIHASLKDGYAVVSNDIKDASKQTPVTLKQRQLLAAGENSNIKITSGNSIRVLTGAKIPEGADTVVAEEFVQPGNQEIEVMADARPGRNILPRGSDVEQGKMVAKKGMRISPGLLGLLAAAGHSRLDVVMNPTVAIIATGDEVVAPGKPLPDGKLYASNITTLAGWCHRYGFTTRLEVVRDDNEKISGALTGLGKNSDAIITSGGAWTGNRDLVAKVLDQLGWQQIFHRIRIGPGKAVGFGLLHEKPVFILPGGPPSNLMGFLQIALPGLLRLGGNIQTGLPSFYVKTERNFESQFADWTQFIYGDLKWVQGEEHPLFLPLQKKSRLRSMAEARAILMISEGETLVPKGSVVLAQSLDF